MTRWPDAYAPDHPLLDFGVPLGEAATHLRGRMVAVAADWPAGSPRLCAMQAQAAEAICASFAVAGITAIAPGAMLQRLAAEREVLGGPDGEAGRLWCWPLYGACGALYVPRLPGWERAGGAVADAVARMIGRNSLVMTEATP